MVIDNTIFELPIGHRELDGSVEHTELTDIDRAVGSFFQMIIDNLKVADEARKENEEFARFCSRPRNQKLYSGEFSSPQEFLTKLASKLKITVDSDRNNLLPTAYITRDPVVTFCDGSDYADISGVAELTNGDTGVPYAIVNKSYARLTYIITTLAWSKATLSRIALGLLMWNRHTKNGRKHVFSAKTMLAGSPMDINIELVGRKEGMGEPVEVDHESTRLFASSIQFEVIAEVFEAESMVTTVGKISVEGACLE